MKKTKLRQAVDAKLTADAEVFEQTRIALQTVFDALNKGQKNKLLKNEEIVSLFERYGVGGDA